MKFVATLILMFFLVHAVSSQIEWNKYQKIVSHRSSDPKDLAQSITENLSTEEEKVQAIYYWVTHNIIYDVKLYEKMKKSKGDKKKYSKKKLKEKERKEVEKTLKSKKGVCQQYSRVFQSLCESVGIQCVFVSGHAKANPKKSGLGEKHAWNAVYYNDNWHLMDPTFGAGYVNENKEFRFAFDHSYFDSEPSAFSMNHLPSQNKWQLSSEVMTKEMYKNNPGVGSGYFKYGLTNPTPGSFKITVDKSDPIVLSFSSSHDLDDINMLNLRKLKLIETESQRDGDRYTITIDPETLKSGIYGISNGKDLLFSYRISVN